MADSNTQITFWAKLRSNIPTRQNRQLQWDTVMSTRYFHLPLTVDAQDYEEKVLDILAKAKPTWDRKSIEIEKTAKGFNNILLVCHDKEESKTSNNSTECDKIIVRVFGGHLGPMPRQPEIEIMKIVSENGIIPTLYGSFQNGVAYGYAPGIILTREEILDQKVLTLIAVKLHAIHILEGEKLKQNTKTYVEWLEMFWTILNSDDLKPVIEDSRFKDHFGSLEHLGKLKSDVTAIYEELVVRYPPVFCHMDIQNQNIVFDSKTDALDDPEARGQWVHTYLSTHPQYKSEPITDELFQKWYRDSLRASMVTTLTIGMWGLFSMVHHAEDCDFFRAVKHQMDRFYRYRKELDVENK